MATTADYLAFVLEQLPPLWDVRSRKMFGEYMVYLNEKPVLLVCDNTVFVKKLPVLDNLDVEDRELTEQVLQLAEAATPLPKPRKKK